MSRTFFKTPVNIVVILVFVLILVGGGLTFRDYGITVDEWSERDTSIINYQYVYKQLRNRDLVIIDHDLDTYEDKYYGVFLQLPMVVMENLTHFTMPFHQIYVMRHLFSFLYCFAGYLCFYFFLKNVFGSMWTALLGACMLALYPRFWGEQFTNIKDMVFMATMCASLLAVSVCLKHEGKRRYEVLTAFAFAVCANTRFIGFVMPCLLFGYRILRDLIVPRDGQKPRLTFKRFIVYLAHPVLTLVIFLLITPASWENPIAFLQGAWQALSIDAEEWLTYHFEVLYLGQLYEGNQLPWHYHLVWLGATLPLWYLAALLPAVPMAFARSVKSEKGFLVSLLDDQKYLLLCFAVPVAITVVPMLRESVFYNGWRHIYFIVPFLVTLMVYPIHRLMHRLQGRVSARRVLAGAMCLLLVGQCAWSVANHPFQKVYFNPIGRSVAAGMDYDYWLESTYAQMRFILDHDPSEEVTVQPYFCLENLIRYRLPKAEAGRLTVAEDGDYILRFSEDDFKKPPLSDATPIHEIAVDGTPLSTLWIRNDVLADRFGGTYPDGE